jgi:hypothetical protein
MSAFPRLQLRYKDNYGRPKGLRLAQVTNPFNTI